MMQKIQFHYYNAEINCLNTFLNALIYFLSLTNQQLTFDFKKIQQILS